MYLHSLSSKTVVRHFPYRTARLGRVLLGVNRDENRELEQTLVRLAGPTAFADNHCVFEIKNEGEPSLYLWMEDLKIYVGTTIIEGGY